MYFPLRLDWAEYEENFEENDNLHQPVIVRKDFNAWFSTWKSKLLNPKGRILEE